jgi:sigma-B regulation protein RsbU (phosphoserine phosphatase)
MPHESREFRISIPAESRHLKAVRLFLESVLADAMGDTLPMVVLAIDEACANVVRHRHDAVGAGNVDLRLTVGADHFQLRIGAFCRTQDLPRIQPRDLADVRPGGLGTHFIGSIMDKVAFEPEPESPGCMALVLEKRRPAAGPS